jgi:DNA-binding LytR/AlgR family response regulator
MKKNTEVSLGSRQKASPIRILFLKADNNYTKIFFNDGSQILSSTTLGTIEQRLKPFNFFRTNRSTVINLDYLGLFTFHYQNRCLKNGIEQNSRDIILSRRRLTAFEACITS